MYACIHVCCTFVLHPNAFVISSMPEAEQMTVNGTISETRRVKGGIQIKVFSLDTCFPSICIIMVRTPSTCVCMCVYICTFNQALGVTEVSFDLPRL